MSEAVAALALQGPFSARVLEAATGEDFGDLRYFRRRRDARSAGIEVDVSRTGYTGDLGYELWIPAERRRGRVGRRCSRPARRTRSGPAGMLALDVTRLEAGLILLEVDYTSARHAMNPEQNYSPFEIGLGRLVSFDKADYVGRRALKAEQAAGGPPRRLVGLMLDWYDIEGLYDAQGLPPAISPDHRPIAVPGVRGRPGGRSARRPRTAGARSSSRRSRSRRSRPRFERVGTPRRRSSGRSRAAGAGSTPTVVELPFLDLERKRA